MSNAGLASVSVSSAVGAIAVIRAKPIDVVLVCDTISRSERERIAKEAKSRGAAVVFIENAAVDPRTTFADRIVEKLEGPLALLDAVFGVLQDKSKTTSEPTEATVPNRKAKAKAKRRGAGRK